MATGLAGSPLAPVVPTEAGRDGQSAGNGPAHCRLNAGAMRHEILCFQNLLSASLRPSPAGCTEETRGERRGPCDMSYDTLVAPWLGGHGWRDLSPGREPSTGFIRPKTIMNIFPSPVSINNGSPLISSPHVPCTILFRHTHARQEEGRGLSRGTVPGPRPRLLRARPAGGAAGSPPAGRWRGRALVLTFRGAGEVGAVTS